MQSYTDDTKMKGMLAYLPVLNVVFYFTERDSHFIRFHSAQSIVLSVTLLLINIVLGLLGGVWVIGFLFLIARWLLNLGWFVVSLFLAIRAYHCDMTRVPVLDIFVDKLL